MSGINELVWVLSIVLAVAFLATGLVKAYLFEQARKRMAWVQDAPQSMVQTIGLVEAICAVGLIVPVATNFYPWLTPIAAAMLALIQLLAIGFNARRKDTDEIALNVLLFILILVVFYGRVKLLAFL